MVESEYIVIRRLLLKDSGLTLYRAVERDMRFDSGFGDTLVSAERGDFCDMVSADDLRLIVA